jgi:hypothetical protein
VRDASAIGEIHACPKCGSMVQIVPPQSWSAEAAPVAAAAVVAIADAPALASTHIPPPSDVAADMFEAAAAAAAAPVVVAPSPAVEVRSDGPATVAPAAVVRSPFVLWSIAGAAVILIGGLTIAFWPDDDSPIAGPAMPVVAAATSPAPLSEPVDNDSTTDQEESTTTGQPHTVAKPAAEVGTIANSEGEPATEDLTADDVTATEPGVGETTEAPAAVVKEDSSPAPSSVPTTGDQVSPVLKFDPLDFDPSQFRLGASTPANTPTTSVVDEPPGDVASPPGEPLESQAEVSKLLLPPQAIPTITVRLGPIPGDALQHDVAEQLALETESLEFTSIPLARFVEMLADVSGLPITLDPQALELAGTSVRGEVTVAAKDTTLAELLRDSLRKSRLDFVEKGGQVLVALPDADRRNSREFDFSDLVDKDSDDAAGLAQLIQTFVSPQSWDASGGDGTIQVNGNKMRIEQTKAVHHELLLFCERLRLARGLAQKSKYPSELLSIDSPYAKLEPRLAEKTTFTFLPWTRVADVLRHWQESSGITILADWYRMADVELGPSAPLACSAIDRPWVEVLDEILEPIGLGWWAVDGATIQITSREAIDEIQRIEFYEIPKQIRDQFTNGSALLETLRAELRDEVGAETAAGDGLQMQLDKPSRRLIVRCTPLMHRYLARRLAVQSDPAGH